MVVNLPKIVLTLFSRKYELITMQLIKDKFEHFQ